MYERTNTTVSAVAATTPPGFDANPPLVRAEASSQPASPAEAAGGAASIFHVTVHWIDERGRNRLHSDRVRARHIDEACDLVEQQLRASLPLVPRGLWTEAESIADEWERATAERIPELWRRQLNAFYALTIAASGVLIVLHGMVGAVLRVPA